MSEIFPMNPEAVRLAETLTFAESGGGPFLLLSESAITAWHGVEDASGAFIYESRPCDYDRACKADGHSLITVGNTQAFVLEAPDSSAFIPEPDGALIVRWIEADEAELLLTAALSTSEEDFELLGVTVPHDGSRLRLFDSATPGRRVAARGEVAAIELPAGRYSVAELGESVVNVKDAKGTVHEVVLQALRLRRV